MKVTPEKENADTLVHFSLLRIRFKTKERTKK